ncbi:hypothetical protein RB623_11660 [Mesorhizobium sp. LHD-90]|uniref:hypothetical protein n=1 Tax=Mesorhizobium sp. LHD-90 TaxID=3071414 RepID=UPI0027E13950|nr:hypothetical protein [Mesorhizobium sp. LHD-90]MDQ6434701.1 hypothetical protein [Mesorhizobium sp. LHD-90]
MTARSAAGLWTIAVAGSVGLHAAIGMVLYAMPMPERKEPARTEIDIATLAAASATRLAVPEAAPATRTEQAAILVPRSGAAIGAAEAPVRAEPVRAAPDEARPVQETASAEPVARNETALQAREETAPANSPETATEAVPTRRETVPVPTRSEAVPVPALSEAVPVETAAKPPPIEGVIKSEQAADTRAASAPLQPAQVAAIAPPETPPARAATTVPASAEAIADSAATAPQAATTVDAIGETVASLEPATPSIAVGGGTTAIAPARPSLSPVAASKPPAASAPAGVASGPAVSAIEPAVAARPSAAQVGARQSSAPAARAPAVVIPSGRSTGAPVTAASPVRPAESAPPVASRVGAGSPAAASPASQATVVAMVPRPDVLADGDEGATSGTLRIAEFLTTRRDDDCMLALPTSITPMQAAIQAFAAAPETVDQLGAEYERLSGLKLEADTQAVSRHQCGALAFARSLAQYPNFPLKLTLAEQVIDSGSELSGAISGLRKDTLYLMVVDDEGKAELITSYSDQRAPLVTFSTPMTLTAGPVSSVQLLIAIASDGPLRTVPQKPGLPAEEYFSRLATEIIAGNRSIAYGITSFVVR